MQNVRPKPILIVQGAQWGSESKGMVAASLCKHKNVTIAVRTGAVNAGHTVYFGGREFKMQQLPTGWVNPHTTMVLGAGAFIHPEILAKELDLVSSITDSDIRKRVVIDPRASLHLPSHQDQAGKEGRHYLIGATGKGCSVAITDKISKRGKGYQLFSQWFQTNQKASTLGLDGIIFADTVQLLHDAYDNGQQILLEGTQGSHLDLHLGPYPYTTHKQTQAAEWVIEAGLAPGMEYKVVMVARTYPIRVAGNSGPMDKETTWPNVARTINRKLMLRRMGQRVKSWAIDEFEKVLHELANGSRWSQKLPRHMDGGVNYDFHKWTVEDRWLFREALSELHAEVMNTVGLRAAQELSNLFELTTVTQKLRRVADWYGPDVAWSCRVNRGAYIALTFFNYWHPELWGNTSVEWSMEYERSCYQVEKDAGIPVRYITTGPEGNHMIRVDKLREEWKSTMTKATTEAVRATG